MHTISPATFPCRVGRVYVPSTGGVLARFENGDPSGVTKSLTSQVWTIHNHPCYVATEEHEEAFHKDNRSLDKHWHCGQSFVFDCIMDENQPVSLDLTEMADHGAGCRTPIQIMAITLIHLLIVFCIIYFHANTMINTVHFRHMLITCKMIWQTYYTDIGTRKWSHTKICMAKNNGHIHDIPEIPK